MILRQVFPASGDVIDIASPDARERLADLYRPPADEWVRLNLIGSVSGSATGADGTSESLTNSADRALLGVIRSLAEVVLVGAASVRAEGYFVPRNAALAVVTRTGDFTGHRITSGGDRGPLVVLCPEGATDRVHETLGSAVSEVIVVPSLHGHLAPADIVGSLRDEGYRSIVSEGGPSFAAQLVRSGVADELCLSTSPRLNGAPVPLFGSGEFDDVELELRQLLVDDASGLYTRWRVRGG